MNKEAYSRPQTTAGFPTLTPHLALTAALTLRTCIPRALSDLEDFTFRLKQGGCVNFGKRAPFSAKSTRSSQAATLGGT